MAKYDVLEQPLPEPEMIAAQEYLGNEASDLSPTQRALVVLAFRTGWRRGSKYGYEAGRRSAQLAMQIALGIHEGEKS